MPRLSFAAVVFTLISAAQGPCPDRPGKAPFVTPGSPRFLQPVFGQVTVTKDIVYGEAATDTGTKQTLLLDVFEPAGDTAPLRPAVVWIHGGSFDHKFTKEHRAIVAAAETFARHGYVGVNIEYRARYDLVRPMTKTMEDCMQDVMKALAWTRNNASRFRIDPNYIALAGQSAGGMISGSFTSLINLDGAPRDRKGIFAQALFWGQPAHPRYPELRPGIDACFPPTVFLIGNDDAVTPYTSAVEMARDLDALGVPRRLQIVEEGDHSLAGREDEYGPMTAQFFHEMLTTGGKPVLPATYQAEQYTRMLNAGFSKSAAGFAGTGYIECRQDCYVEWDYVGAPSAGERNLQLRYWNPSEESLRFELRVNKASQGNVVFEPSPGWVTLSVPVPLPAGNNTIRIAAATAGTGLGLDSMHVSE